MSEHGQMAIWRNNSNARSKECEVVTAGFAVEHKWHAFAAGNAIPSNPKAHTTCLQCRPDARQMAR
eukprot:544472-Prorocentrum_minimum.AAC.7